MMFRIKKVLLTKSSFEVFSVASPHEEGVYDADVIVSHDLKPDNELIVTLSVSLNANGDDGSLVLSANVKMDGVFEIKGESSNVDYIANVNAAAILYPFVRQHIADLTIRSAAGSILIPPFNFVTNYKESLEKDKFEREKAEQSE